MNAGDIVIHIDATHCATKGGRSGIPRVVREFTGALRGAGVAVAPVVWEEADQAFLRPHFFHRRNLDSITRRHGRRARAIVPLRQKAWNALTRPFRHGAVDSFAGGWVVLAETFSDGRIEWVKRHGKGSGFRLAAVFHDAIGHTHPEWIPEWHRRRFDAYLDSLSRCDLVVCISRQSEGDLRNFWETRGLSPAPTRVLLLPATDLVSLPGSVNPSPSEAPNILYVASLEPRKNHAILLEACERLWEEGQSFRLILVGQRPRHGAELIVAAIERCRARGRPIDWCREIDDLSLAGLYRNCAFTVYPSLKEGFGLPIVESAGFGKACICHGEGAIAEAAAGGGCLQVDVADPQALGDAISRLLTDKAERHRLEVETLTRQFISWKDWAASFRGLLREAETR